MAYDPIPQKNTFPLENDDYVPTRQLPQFKTRYGFDRTIANGVHSDMTLLINGTGQTVNQSAGSLVITSGTTARSETIIRTAATWKDAITLRYATILSQRIANNNFFIELVDVIGDGLAYSIGSSTAITVTIPSNPFTSQNIGQSINLGSFAGTGTFLSGSYPIASVVGNDVTFTVSGFTVGVGTCSLFGWNYHHILYNGTTATSNLFGNQRNGYPIADISSTINTSASPGHVGALNVEDGISVYADQLSASSTSVQLTLRSQNVRNIPDSNVVLHLQIRSVNGSTTPATSTTWTIGFIDVENYVPQQVSLTSIRPQSFNSLLPVEISRMIALPTGTNTIGNIGTIVPGTGATNLAKARNSAVGATDTILAAGFNRNDTLTLFGTSGSYTIPIADRYGATIVKDQQKHKRTYSVSFTVVLAASATDIFQLIGSASTNVQVTKIIISGIQTTAGQVLVLISKRSTANSGGTSTTATLVPNESTDAAATAVGTIYTANPTLGTPVGNVRAVYVPIGSATAGYPPFEINLAERGKPIILAGVAQTIAINLNGVTVAGGTMAISIEFTEE